MISEEKMIHIVHLMLDGIWKQDLVDYPNEEEALREAKKLSLGYINQINAVGEIVQKKILSQKNPPREGTPQWDTLYQKYLLEEVQKKGG
ncbi:MAG: DUF507 family protein [Proteobacteria bacterium]|nr:DUF507 family protein [Pseudomonadota bacterium]NDC22963.1 DUF507 family protein [Pseudomonadota bacterium]